MECPNCGSKNLHQHGKTSSNRQRWRCQDCHKTFTEKPVAIKISDRVLEKIRKLPQIQTSIDEDGWTEEYFIEQVLRVFLEMEADYDLSDLYAVKANQIVV